MKTVRIGNKGVITLPVELRRQYGLEVGDVLTVADAGGGTIVLAPMISEVARQGDRVAELLGEYGVSTDEILRQLEEEREAYYRQHFAQPNKGQ